MNVKNALHDNCNSLIGFLKGLIDGIEQANANLHNIPETWMFNREEQRKLNNLTIATYRDEIIELEDLRDGHITVDRLGTARRFFNTTPAWATSGT